MAFRFIALASILQLSAARVDFEKSKLFDEYDFTQQFVEITKNIYVHDYMNDDISLYDISKMKRSEEKGYFNVENRTQLNFINNNPNYFTAPLAVWIVRKDADNIGYAKVFEAASLNTKPASLEVVTVMSAEPFTLRTNTEGSMQLVGTLTGYDAVTYDSGNGCANVIEELDSDHFSNIQAVVQSPLVTLFFDAVDFENTKTTLTAAVGNNVLDFSGISFIASPGFILCKGSQTFRSSLYAEYSSIEYSTHDWFYDVLISPKLFNDASHPVKISDKTNDLEYMLSSANAEITLLQTTNVELGWDNSDNSFLIFLTPLKEVCPTCTAISAPETTTAQPSKTRTTRSSSKATTTATPIKHTTLTPRTTTTESVQEAPRHSCPSQLTLYRDGQCRGYYATGHEYMNDSSAKAIWMCSRINAFPVSIHTDEEQSYWSAIKPSGYFTLGLTCNTNKHWEWADGTELDYKPRAYDKELDGNCISALGCNWYLKRDGSWRHNCTHTSASTDFFCIAQLTQPTPSTDCGNFIDGSDETTCYEIAEAAETWDGARSICHSFGAELASIHNQQQNSYIRRLAVSRGAVDGVFLGGAISEKGNSFAWVDGSEWDYTNFQQGYPITDSGDCLSMDTATTSGLWRNTDCNARLPAVCARPLYTPELAGCLSGPWKEGEIIYSPGFPNDASTPCEYFFTVEAGRKVQLQILLLEANSCCDFLIIEEGYDGSSVVAVLTGEVSGATYRTIHSNVMRVMWQPNGGVNVRGVMMTFKAV